MNCPECGCKMSQALVIDSRTSGTAIRRRRECKSCGYRFTTYEITEEDYSVLSGEAKKSWEAIKEAERLAEEMQKWRVKYGR